MTDGSAPSTAGQGPHRASGAEVGAALRFMAAARRDPGLHERLSALAPEEGLGVVVELATEPGFPISAEGLRRAFVIDWGLRRARYLRDS